MVRSDYLSPLHTGACRKDNHQLFVQRTIYTSAESLTRDRTLDSGLDGGLDSGLNNGLEI